MRLMPRTRVGVFWRALLAFVVVVGCAAGATATAGLLQFKQVASYFDRTRALADVSVPMPAPGAPETLILIGTDHRKGQTGFGNTDTMILLRINDSSSTINVLSIPRDLGVEIPGVGYSKVNAAFADGGAQLLLKTLRTNVFPGLGYSHVIVINFSGFAKLINEIGCVYGQVDHRYYNKNIGTIATDYSGIDIEPGYQKLCGGSGADLGGPDTALAFVRFRHNDSDLVRESRQQDFLRWAKQDYSSSQLLSNKDELLRTFAANVSTDANLHRTDGLIELFDLAINANSSTVKSIPFPVEGTTASGNLTFSEAASAAAYSDFMTPTTAPPAKTTTTVTPPRITTTPSSAGQPSGKRSKRTHIPPVATVPAGMKADPGDGESQAAHLGSPGLPIYYPRNIPDDFTYCFGFTGNCSIGYEPVSAYTDAYPRSYAILGRDGKHYPSYVMTLVLESGGVTDTGTGQYFTVQGTTWQDPPILRSPSGTKRIGGKLLFIYKQAGAVSLVAWHTKRAVYWISNTLQNTIPPGQMVSTAASFAKARG